jgi:hypothetical protein
MRRLFGGHFPTYRSLYMVEAIWHYLRGHNGVGGDANPVMR